MANVDLKIELVGGAGSSGGGGSGSSKKNRAKQQAKTQKSNFQKTQDAYHRGRGLASSPIKNVAGGMGGLLGPLGPALGTFTGLLAGAGIALYGLTRAIDASSERLGKYSPEISKAKAETKVKDILSKIERAEDLGKRFAHWEESWGDFKRGVSEGWDYVMSWLGEWGASALDWMADIPKNLRNGYGEVLKSLNKIGLVTDNYLKEYQDWLKEKKAKDAAEEANDRINAVRIENHIKDGGEFAPLFPEIMPRFGAGTRGRLPGLGINP